MEVTELWRLRDELFDNLPPQDPAADAQRAEVQYHLDSAFPAGGAGAPLE